MNNLSRLFYEKIFYGSNLLPEGEEVRKIGGGGYWPVLLWKRDVDFPCDEIIHLIKMVIFYVK